MKKVFILFALTMLSQKGISQVKLDYAKTWVFMVGVLEWADGKTFAPFEKEGRVDAKIMNFFEKQGVPVNQMLYIKDEGATTNTVREAFMTFLKKAKKDDMLFFYYCGHG